MFLIIVVIIAALLLCSMVILLQRDALRDKDYSFLIMGIFEIGIIIATGYLILQMGGIL